MGSEEIDIAKLSDTRSSYFTYSLKSRQLQYIPFLMDVIKLMAKCNNHHQNDFELERNNSKHFTRRFCSYNQKWGSK